MSGDTKELCKIEYDTGGYTCDVGIVSLEHATDAIRRLVRYKREDRVVGVYVSCSGTSPSYLDRTVSISFSFKIDFRFYVWCVDLTSGEIMVDDVLICMNRLRDGGILFVGVGMISNVASVPFRALSPYIDTSSLALVRLGVEFSLETVSVFVRAPFNRYFDMRDAFTFSGYCAFLSLMSWFVLENRELPLCSHIRYVINMYDHHDFPCFHNCGISIVDDQLTVLPDEASFDVHPEVLFGRTAAATKNVLDIMRSHFMLSLRQEDSYVLGSFGNEQVQLLGQFYDVGPSRLVAPERTPEPIITHESDSYLHELDEFLRKRPELAGSPHFLLVIQTAINRERAVRLRTRRLSDSDSLIGCVTPCVDVRRDDVTEHDICDDSLRPADECKKVVPNSDGAALYRKCTDSRLPEVITFSSTGCVGLVGELPIAFCVIGGIYKNSILDISCRYNGKELKPSSSSGLVMIHSFAHLVPIAGAINIIIRRPNSRLSKHRDYHSLRRLSFPGLSLHAYCSFDFSSFQFKEAVFDEDCVSIEGAVYFSYEP